MANRTLPDLTDVCYPTDFTAAFYENKIYIFGGEADFGGRNATITANAYLSILDFSAPVNSSKNSIDITTDSVISGIDLSSDNIPALQGATLFISDGVMHLLPGGFGDYRNTYQTDLRNKVWNFDLKSLEWSVQVSGIEHQVQFAAVAFDAEEQVGWYYGGYDDSTTVLQDLYRLGRGEMTPIKVETDSHSVGGAQHGGLVYIGGVGEAGILVLMGGALGQAPDELRSMQTVFIFDIATKTWFHQVTTESSPPDNRSGFCSVAASAEDNSSHNIYIYGGFNSNNSLDDVFILTLPAFKWVPVYLPPEQGATDYGRKHQCQKVYEKHMVAYRDLCVVHDLSVYDMSSLEWTTKVEVENQRYFVPERLYEIIGGNSMGNATITEPLAGWLDPKLAQVFAAQRTPIMTSPANSYSQSRLPVAAMVGIIVGGFALLIAGFFLLWRRQCMAVSLQLSEMPSSTEPQELQECGLNELDDFRNMPELPSLPIELDSSVP